ncbi:MAG: hypothetical protein KDA95_06450 [Acidimicrobiales bacterium]|nr:hypothetical protein [Acidimicrobiales bacterium]
MTTSDPISTPPIDTDTPAHKPTRPAWKSWVIASVITAALLIGAISFMGRSGNESDAVAANANQVVTTSSAQSGQNTAGPNNGFGSGAFGEVTNVDGTTLTVESTDAEGSTSTSTILTSDETEVSETVEGTVADLAVGDNVMVRGEQSDNTVTARSVTVGDTGFGGGGAGGPRSGEAPPEGFEPPTDGAAPPSDDATPPQGSNPDDTTEQPTQGQRPNDAMDMTSGEIVSLESSTLTIKTGDDETVVVNLPDDLTVRITETRSVSDIKVGDTIRAMGESKDNQIQATRIVIGDISMGPGSPTMAPGGPSAATRDSGGATTDAGTAETSEQTETEN